MRTRGASQRALQKSATPPTIASRNQAWYPVLKTVLKR